MTVCFSQSETSKIERGVAHDGNYNLLKAKHKSNIRPFSRWVLGHIDQLWFSVLWATQECKYWEVGIIEDLLWRLAVTIRLSKFRQEWEIFLIATQMVNLSLVNLKLDNIKDLSRVSIIETVYGKGMGV